MNREILFRGKRLDNGEWVKGAIICQDDRCFINPQNNGTLYCHFTNGRWIFGDYLEVAPATMGQYTGQDIQGVKLFDGDIIRRNDGMIFRAAWSNLYLGWDAHGVKLLDSWSLDVVLSKGACEIIGNIWDTPELLKEGEEND